MARRVPICLFSVMKNVVIAVLVRHRDPVRRAALRQLSRRASRRRSPRPERSVEGNNMGHRKFNDVVGDLNAERRSRIDAIKDDARADAVAFNLAELRRHRQLTQVELAERLERAQASVSAMETADDNLLSTVRSVVESMGGRLELVAVFDDERIAIATR
jgi:DNA-binding XRE family transcriptional regulator